MMDDLSTEIAEMFAELNGYDAYFERIAIVDSIRRRKAVLRMKEWRKANPDRARAQLVRSVAKYRAKHPDKVKQWRASSAARRKAKATATSKAKERARWRKAQSESRARKRAAKKETP